MTVARKQLVDPAVTPYYHCISRCVRRAFLCGDGCQHRKQWIENRLRELADIFAVGVCAYAVMDNHLHVVLQLNEDLVNSWSDEQVVRRWGQLYPPRGKDRQPLDVSEQWVRQQLRKPARIRQIRERLNSLSWFMRCLKEPLSRMANREDNCKGAFWEARFKSIAILDEEALLTTLAYVDLNPLAAGISQTPEDSDHTSIKARLERCQDQGRMGDLLDQPADRTRHDQPLEDELFWLVPLQDRREQGQQRKDVTPNINLASYLRLLDWSARLVRPGKARMPRDIPLILERLGSNPGQWQEYLQALTERERLYGVAFAVHAESLERYSQSRSVGKLSNLNGCRRTASV